MAEHPKRIQDWMKGRTRAGVPETVTGVTRLAKYPAKNTGLPTGPFECDHLHCPCSVCGHTYIADCEAADCECCSSTCT